MRSSSVAIAAASIRPIQIGIAFWPSESLSTRIGMLVKGSIVSPDTFMSTIIQGPPRKALPELAQERMRPGLDDSNVYFPADQVCTRLASRQAEIDDVISTRTAAKLAPALLAFALYQHALASPHESCQPARGNFALQGLYLGESLAFDSGWNIV